GNGRFVIAGDSGTILHSTNGRDWAQISLQITQHLNAVAFGAGRFLIGGDQVLLLSDDGVNWTNVTWTNLNFNLLSYGTTTNFPGGIFIAVAFQGFLYGFPYPESNFYYSSNGLKWTKAFFPIGGI